MMSTFLTVVTLIGTTIAAGLYVSGVFPWQFDAAAILFRVLWAQ